MKDAHRSSKQVPRTKRKQRSSQGKGTSNKNQVKGKAEDRGKNSPRGERACQDTPGPRRRCRGEI